MQLNPDQRPQGRMASNAVLPPEIMLQIGNDPKTWTWTVLW